MTAPARAGVPVGKTLFLGFVASTLALVGNVVVTFVTTATGTWAWLAAPAIGILVSTVSALASAYANAHADRMGPVNRGQQYSPPAYRPAGPGSPAPWSPPAPRRRGKSLGAVILICVVVCGGGVFAATLGVRYAVGWISGEESGPERLVSQAEGSAADLTLTVESVQSTTHFTRVQVTARNDGDLAVTLPLFSNCTLVGDDGTSLQADDFRSDWSQSVPTGGFPQRGTITFVGQLPESVSEVRLSFVHSFRMGPGPDGIAVTGIQVRPS
jgi:hypothetical protein